MAKKTMQPITKENSYGRRMVPEYLIDKLEKASAKLVASGSIKDLTTDEINDLQAGDIVVKTTGDQKHTYIVTYKEEGQGICLSYFNAGYSETVSFDYVDGEWVYNSTDITNENLMEEIRDSKGNLRFVEDNGVSETISGVTISYNKWSLSGTHLMCVIFGSVENTTVIDDGTTLSTFNLPSYILDKIIPVQGTRVSWGSIVMHASDFSSQTISYVLNKITGGLQLKTNAGLTLSKDRNFRVQFDLLIDNE